MTDRADADEHILRRSDLRLAHLLAERAKPGADVRRIDERIWELFGEEWAVMFTDLCGFTRQVDAFGIIHFLQVIQEHKALLFPIIVKHDGVLVKIEADSLLLIFRRAPTALACAIEMQRACQQANERRHPDQQILLAVGVGFGKILRIGDTDVFGAEVNAASKLGEDNAKAHEILVTQSVKDAAATLPEVSFEATDIVITGAEANYRAVYRRS
jgi:adenylate cyclase